VNEKKCVQHLAFFVAMLMNCLSRCSMKWICTLLCVVLILACTMYWNRICDDL
jgi:hypothetical protein